MKVLLCDDVKGLGWLGDVVEVRDGFARNYLLPEGLAKFATDENIKSLAGEKAKRAEQRLREEKRLAKAAADVDSAEAVLSAKANVQGHLFGSVTAADIANNLREQGFEVADEVVRLTENIKQVGTTEVNLQFAEDITAKVTVVVVPADAESAAAEAQQTPSTEPSAVERTDEQQSQQQQD